MVKDIDFASYADDSTPFTVKENIEDVIASLEEASNALFDCLKSSRLKSNADICHALVSLNEPVDIKIGD